MEEPATNGRANLNSITEAVAGALASYPASVGGGAQWLEAKQHRVMQQQQSPPPLLLTSELVASNLFILPLLLLLLPVSHQVPPAELRATSRLRAILAQVLAPLLN